MNYLEKLLREATLSEVVEEIKEGPLAESVVLALDSDMDSESIARQIGSDRDIDESLFPRLERAIEKAWDDEDWVFSVVEEILEEQR